MNKNFWIIFVCATALPALAADNIVIIGHGNAPSSSAFGSQAPKWLLYLIPVIFLVAGLVHLFYPRVGWWLKYGWKFGDSVEPSSLWLFFERLAGVILIGISIFLLVTVSGGQTFVSK